MNKKNNLIRVVTLLILGATFCPVCAESLDDILNSEETNVPVVSKTTQKSWTNLLDSLQKSDFSNAMNQAHSFINTKDNLEPYQNTFTTLVLELLPGKESGYNDAEFMAKRRELIITRKESERLKNDLAVNQKQMASFPPRVLKGTEEYKRLVACQQRLADNKRATKDVEAKISHLQQEVDSALATKKEQIRTRTITSIEGLQTIQDYCAVVALANTYLKKVGSDSEIEKLVQDAINLRKAQIKAIKIAKVALQPAVDSLEKGRYWDVKPEITKAVDKINSRVTNKEECDFIKLEIVNESKDLDRKVEAIIKEREFIFESAKKNALEGMKRLEAFHTKHQGYPDYEKDRLLIENMQREQSAQKYVEQIAAIEAVIPNDIDEAQKMLDELIKSGLPADKASILKAKITERRRDIIEREEKLIRADIDEAHSYLTKIDKNIAIDIREGRKPVFYAKVKEQQGHENLVRARSLQAGAVKRLEILLNQEMDAVIKSRLVGLLEPQKVVLGQMDVMLRESEASALR